MQGGPASLANTNTGTIFGDYNGVYTSASAPLTLDNAGTITGRRGPAIEADGGGTFVNSGTVQSASDGILIRGSNATAITNRGTIGSTGGGRAIVFTGTGSRTLILDTGSVLNGDVQGRAANVTDFLELTGTGTESIAKFLAFDTLAMQGTAWTLTGDGAFASSAEVRSGILAVNGTLTTPAVRVFAGATLGGTGTLIGNVTNNGIVAPGNSIGTLNITGNYRQATGSTYQVEVDATPASDLLSITGSATIDSGAGVHVIAAPGTYTLGQRYAILTAAGGVTGTYDTLTDNAAFVDFGLAYDANNVYLDVTRNAVLFNQVGETPNQRAAATGAEALGLGHPVYDSVALLDRASALHAFDRLSGEIHAGVRGVLLEDSFVRQAISARLAAGEDAGIGAPGLVMAYAPAAREGRIPAARPPVALWAQAAGNWGRTRSDGNAGALNRSYGALLSGVDVTVGEHLLGFAAGYQQTAARVGSRDSSAQIDSYHLAAYGAFRYGAAALRLGTAYAWHDVATARSIVFPGFAETAEARYRAGTWQIFGEVAHAFALGGARLEPYAGLAHLRVRTPGFAERGGFAALSGRGETETATFSTLGLRAEATLPLAGGPAVTAKAGLGWRHAWDGTLPTATLAFAAGAGQPFSVAATPLARDAALLDLALEARLTPATTLAVSYAGQFSRRSDDHGARGSLLYRF